MVGMGGKSESRRAFLPWQEGIQAHLKGSSCLPASQSYSSRREKSISAHPTPTPATPHPAPTHSFFPRQQHSSTSLAHTHTPQENLAHR